MTQAASDSSKVTAGPLKAIPGQALQGRLTVPGDKSMSHRALIFAGLAEGTTRIQGLLEAEDVLRTGACLRALGVSIERDRSAEGHIFTVKGSRWRSPQQTLYCGNSGTGARLLMGALAGQGVAARLEGDASLRRRPMGRVLTPLRQMGLGAQERGGCLPVCLKDARLKGTNWRMQNASAQVKSAILLAALGAEGCTTVEEPILSRDHTERMLQAFGVELHMQSMEDGGRRLQLEGGQSLSATNLTIPADPSSAAFPIVAALITPGSDVTITGVLLNPGRTGLFTTLKEMGAAMTFHNERITGGEQVADIRVQYSALKAVHTPASRAPSMIDEYPVLAVAAAFAGGTSRFDGLAELRIKESDRLAAIAEGLTANGVGQRSGPDWLEVDGQATVPGGGSIKTYMDHRIAMSFLVMGMAADRAVTIDSGAMMATSFPSFVPLMRSLGGAINPA